MMSTIGKVLAGVAGAGTLGGAGVGAYYAFFSSNSDTISKQLLAEGFTLISEEADWTNLKTKHKTAKKDTFEGDKESIDLKSKCETILNEKPNTKNYKLARKWCVKEEKIKDILERGGYKILKSADSDSTDKVLWEQKVDLLKPNLERFKALKEKIQTQEKAEGNNVKEFKKACLNLSIDTTLTTTDEFDENFDLAREWCSIKQNDANS